MSTALFWSKVDKRPTGCWLWTAGKVPDGYGAFQLYGRSQRAHRVAYELLIGPIPDGMVLDHFLMNTDPASCSRACVNPSHLEPVTSAENTRRSRLHRERSREWGLGRRQHDLPEGLQYIGRGVRARIREPGAGVKHLGCRTPATPEAIEELSAIYQRARAELSSSGGSA